MTELRDARLQQALTHAPDDGQGPSPAVRARVQQEAHRAVAPAAVVDPPPLWRRLWDAAGRTGGVWPAAFATVLLATVVTAVWWDAPAPGASPDRQSGRDAGPGRPDLVGSAAPATAPAATALAPTERAAPAQSDAARLDAATADAARSNAMRSDAAPPDAAPIEAAPAGRAPLSAAAPAVPPPGLSSPSKAGAGANPAPPLAKAGPAPVPPSPAIAEAPASADEVARLAGDRAEPSLRADRVPADEGVLESARRERAPAAPSAQGQVPPAPPAAEPAAGTRASTAPSSAAMAPPAAAARAATAKRDNDTAPLLLRGEPLAATPQQASDIQARARALMPSGDAGEALQAPVLATIRVPGPPGSAGTLELAPPQVRWLPDQAGTVPRVGRPEPSQLQALLDALARLPAR